MILNKLTFNVGPGQKVGIVGRTGSGKSTTSMALMRIVELAGGKIEIDGVDISKIDLAVLRSQITMIPQDPILFSGTLRYNLDPFDEVTDDRIIDLIKKAGLEYLLDGKSKQEILDEQKRLELEKAKNPSVDANEKVTQKQQSNEGKGLNFNIKEEGKNLSMGERQLICIIRAILRSNKIVILDEATANIDVVTEQTIQRLINEEFVGASVICIAHRLNTIIRSDKVLVLDEGRALEFDSPQNLMANPNSTFSKMLKEKERQKKNV